MPEPWNAGPVRVADASRARGFDPKEPPQHSEAQALAGVWGEGAAIRRDKHRDPRHGIPKPTAPPGRASPGGADGAVARLCLCPCAAAEHCCLRPRQMARRDEALTDCPLGIITA